MKNNQPVLQGKGLDVSPWITELATQKQEAGAKNDQQETLKASLRARTVETESALERVGSPPFVLIGG